MSIEEKNIPLEYYKNNQDAIRKAVYEKCSRGEITLAQREQVLGVLNEYVEASETILDKFINVFENYLEDKLTDEEFDTMVESYMEEQPELFHTIFGDDIMKRSIMLKECVQMVYEEGGVDREEGKALFDRIDEMTDMEYIERTKFLTDDTVMESAYDEKVDPVELGDGFLTVADHVVTMEENGELSREDCHHELIRMVNEYCDVVGKDLLDETNPSYEAAVDYSGMVAGKLKAPTTHASIAAGAVIALSFLLTPIITSIIVDPVVNKAKSKKVISGFEKLKAPKIKFSDLKFKSKNIQLLAEKIPELASAMKKEEKVKGKGYEIYYKDKLFAVVAKCNDANYNFGLDTTAQVKTPKSRIFYNQIMKNADTKPFVDYYRTATLMRKFGFVDNDARKFLKELLKELNKQAKEEEKRAKQEKNAKKKASKSTSKVTKEFAEHAEGQDLFESVEREIYARYNRGEYTLDQREELLMEARNRYFTGE